MRPEGVPVNIFPRAEKKGKSVVAAVLIAIAAAIFVIGLICWIKNLTWFFGLIKHWTHFRFSGVV
jgi:hypothetical protein